MPRQPPGSSLRAARELYLEVTKDPSARPLVVASWHRSLEYEVQPSSLDAPYQDNPDLDSHLARRRCRSWTGCESSSPTTPSPR